jgi:phage terminase large subunit GpA-like protein
MSNTPIKQAPPKPLREIVRGFLDGLRPTERITVAEWADKYRFLSGEASAEPGRWRTSRTPYLEEIMQKLSSIDPAKTIVFMKAAQIGGTEIGCNWVGYVIDVDPAPMLMVMPTGEAIQQNSKIRITPMIEDSPRLSVKVAKPSSRNGDNNILLKKFAGGLLKMTTASSGTGLRSIPIRYLFLDEVDGYPLDVDGEGSPIDLARARTRTFASRKIYIISTPTVEGKSVIAKEFESTDQRYYHVPCPHCDHKQTLKFENLRWTDKQPQTAMYFCEGCGTGIEERHKTWMLEHGEWVQTKPENANIEKVGYHINSMYSPYGWYSWANLASDYELALEDSSGSKMKTFYNTVLGLTWKEKGEVPEHDLLYERAENYQIGIVPDGVAFLTAGVDVQKDRIEMEVVGWCKGKQSYSICYDVILGNTAEKETWAKLRPYINRMFQRVDGLQLPISITAIDTGYNTTEVYDFCSTFDYSKVIPIKGQDNQNVVLSHPKAVEVNHKGKKIGGVKVWHVGSSLLKSELYSWLSLSPNYEGDKPVYPAGYCHFPKYPIEYFKGLTGEQRVATMRKGYTVYQWQKIYRQNEPLDCRVYARAAAAQFGMDRMHDGEWDNLILYSQGVTQHAPPKKREGAMKIGGINFNNRRAY